MRRSLSIPLLLFIALLAWTLMTPSSRLLRTAPPPAAPQKQLPDSYARGVVTSQYDDSGQLVSEMIAEELRYFRPRGRVEIDAPQRSSYGVDGNWIATANSGVIFEAREALRLNGDVQLSYTAADPAVDESAEFRTEAMVINLADNTARSLAPAVAWFGDNRISAPQLVVNLDREVAVLRGGVKSRYAPPR